MPQRTRADSPTKTCTMDDCERPLRARGLCATHYNQTRYTQEQRHPRIATACAVCGTLLVRAPDPRRRPACSTLCRRLLQFGEVSTTSAYQWARDAVWRAKKAGAVVIEVFDRADVFARDGWRCYICRRECDPEANPFDSAAATVDHVVPLSRGGAHALANVRTCCLGCNSTKRDHAA